MLLEKCISFFFKYNYEITSSWSLVMILSLKDIRIIIIEYLIINNKKVYLIFNVVVLLFILLF